MDRQDIATKLQMVTNLLRSEHIPYNVFYPMQKDPEGAARLSTVSWERSGLSG